MTPYFTGSKRFDKMIADLPIDIFRIIASYSTHDDFHYLLNTSHNSFQHIKKRLMVLNLCPRNSVKYLTNGSFRERVLSVVENGWKQVNVHVVEGYWNISDLSVDIPIYSFRRTLLAKSDESSELTALEKFAHIERVAGIHCRGPVPPLPRVKELEIMKIDGLMFDGTNNLSHLEKLEIANAHYLTEMSTLRNIPNLSMLDCEEIQDFSIFHHSRQKRLVLEYCTNLVSVESFRMIHHLELLDCENLVDVTPLHGIYHLVLQYCQKVTDISGLGGHHRLLLASCGWKMIGYETLLHIPHVSLYRMSIIDVSVLRYAKSVILDECIQVRDFSSLKNVESFTLGRGYLSSINLQRCSYLSNLSTMKIRKLNLEGEWRSPNSFAFLSSEVRELTLKLSSHFTNLLSNEVNHLPQYFKHLQCLTLKSLLIKSVDGLGDIPHLRLISCEALQDISALGRNRCVEIIECYMLKDVRSLATVPIVTIRDCPKIKGYENVPGLRNVPRLKVFFSEYLE